MDIFATLIVPAANVDQARTTAAAFPGGDGMFTSELSATGNTPTHYISSGYLPAELLEQLRPLCSVSEGQPMDVMAAEGLRMCA